jgi:acetyltransferase-like isoleucine patch superfamily enzyme
MDPLAGISTENVSLPSNLVLDPDEGRVDPDFLASLRSDPDAFRALSSDERVAAYREHGAAIGEGVVLGERTLIIAPQIALEDRVVIGDDCDISCDEVFAVGALTHFAHRLEVRCRRASFGTNGHIGRHVRIGGGGARDPWGTFAAGDLLFLGDEAYVNPCRPVLIGREVFLTMRSVIVTHNIGHSVLEGFENRFAPVVIEDRAQIGIGTVVYAGCRIGREAIVGSNSYVVTNIPAGKLALGVPAEVAVSASRPLPPDRRSRVLAQMLDDLRELLELRGYDVAAGNNSFTLTREGEISHVLALDEVGPDFEAPTGTEVVVLTLSLNGGAPPRGCAVLDLLERRVHGEGGVVLDSVREFCRKRGIRFEPGPWRYSGGLI